MRERERERDYFYSDPGLRRRPKATRDAFKLYTGYHYILIVVIFKGQTDGFTTSLQFVCIFSFGFSAISNSTYRRGCHGEKRKEHFSCLLSFVFFKERRGER